jgi:hypothetical protein
VNDADRYDFEFARHSSHGNHRPIDQPCRRDVFGGDPQ